MPTCDQPAIYFAKSILAFYRVVDLLRFIESTA
jgi:hypothetical protein